MKALQATVRRNVVAYKTPLLFTSASMIRAFATIAVGAVIAKFVLPEQLGVFTTLMLFVTYANFLQLGAVSGLNLELPLEIGRGNVEKAKRIAGTIQSFTVVSCIAVIVLGSVFFSAVNVDFNSSQNYVRFLIPIVLLIAALTFYQNYLLATFRSNSSFLKLSVIQLAESVFNLASIVLVVYLAFEGLIIKTVLVLLFYVIILHIARPIKVPFYWDTHLLKQVIKVGFPIFILSYIEVFAVSADKLFLINYSTLRDVGIYSFAAYSLTAFSIFSSSVASYLYPKLTFNYGKNKNRLILWGYVKKITILLLGIQSLLFIACYFAVPVVITRFFSQYVDSIPVIHLLILAGVMKGSVIGVNVLWSMKAWKSMVLYQVGTAVVLLLAIFIFIHIIDNKSVAVASGVLAGNIFGFILGIYLSYKETHYHKAL